MNDAGKIVLACIDGSTFSEAVVDYAAWLSRTMHKPLKLLHNLDRRTTPSPNLSGNIGLGARENILKELVELDEQSSRSLLEQGNRMLQQARERALSQNAFEPVILQRHGPLTNSLVDLEDEIGLLVVGIRGEDHELQDHQLGNQLETIIRAIHRPVLVVNRPFQHPPQRLMLAYDGGEAARKALAWISHSPLNVGMHCHIVQVNNDPTAAKSLFDEAVTLLGDVKSTVTTACLQGDAGQALCQYQDTHSIDIMVMGAFSHSRMREMLFGSTTLKLLGKSQVPLMLMR